MNGTPEIADVELSFGEPQHGWMPVELEIGEFMFRGQASNVLNDPLEDFLELRAFLLGDALGRHRVSLWLEPAGYVVEVTRRDEALASVDVWFERALAPPVVRDASECVFEGVAERRAVARRIEQAYWVLRREHASQVAEWGDVERYDALLRGAGHRPG